MFIDLAQIRLLYLFTKTTYSAIGSHPIGEQQHHQRYCSQQIEEEDAEELKKKYGNAYADKSEDGDDNLPTRWTGNAVLSHTYWKTS